jgi:amino acid adenylation domain-containing protein
MFRETSLTYRELDQRSDAIAAYLQQQGVPDQSHIGISLTSSPDAISAVLGVLKFGRAFVPIDPGYPHEQARYVSRNAGLSIILTTSTIAGKLPADIARTVPLDRDLPVHARAESVEPAVRNTLLDSPADILYTSGSTGYPKGVIRPHRAIVARLAWMDFDPDDVFCHNMSLNVGFSQERLLLPLMRGLPLAVIPEEDYSEPRRFVTALESHGVTQLTLTPHTLGQVLDLGPAITAPLRTLRSVAVGGAPLTADLRARFVELLPTVDLVNAYGSTESGSAIRGVVRRGPPSGIVLLGKPVAGATVRILDPDLTPCAQDVVGEICVEGPSIALGYLNDPPLTGERFVPSPFSPSPGQMMCRTGDRGRFLEDGSIEFLGRLDRQVKIRGFRVEPGEVEEALVGHAGVEEAFVTTSGPDSARRLLAYIAPSPGTNLTVEELRGHLGQRLPGYMLPASFSFVDRLPRSLGGKIDASVLLVPDAGRPRLSAEYRPPHGPIETAIAGIWTSHLGIGNIGVDDDFMALGGDSLAVVQMLVELRRVVNLEPVSSKSIATPLTIARLAEALKRRAGDRDKVTVPVIERARRESPLALSFAQEAALSYESTAQIHSRRHDQSRTGLILSIGGPLDPELLERALNAIVRRHEVLRATFFREVVAAGVNLGGIESLTPDLLKGPMRPVVRFRQTIQPEAPLRIEHISVEHLREQEREAEIERLIGEAVHFRFDYEFAPLMKAALLKAASDRHILVIAMSHLVSDGGSLEVLRREISVLYEAFSMGDPDPLPEPDFQYVDFAHWQRQALRGEYLQKLTAYWETQYRRYPLFGIGELSIVRPLPSDPDISADYSHLALAPETIQSLRVLARDVGVTLFLLCLTAFNVLLHLSSGKERLGVVTFFSGRTLVGLEDLIGWFSEPHVVGVSVEPDSPVPSLLYQVREAVNGAQAHQEMPAPLRGKRLREMGIGRSARERAESPPVSLEMRRYSKIPSPPGLSIQRIPFMPRNETEWGLRVWITEREDAVSLTALYPRQRFDRADIVRFLEDFQSLLERLPDSMDRNVAEFSACVSAGRA